MPGAVLILMAIYGWSFEPVDDPDGPHGHHHDHGGDELVDGGSGATPAEEAPVG